MIRVQLPRGEGPDNISNADNTHLPERSAIVHAYMTVFAMVTREHRI
jgi:hypothetical protein